MHVCKRACDSADDVHIDMACHRSKPASLNSHVWFEHVIGASPKTLRKKVFLHAVE
jgi:hypothetical protein